MSPVRVLCLGKSNLDKTSKVLAHARKKKHWYLVGDGGVVATGEAPGHDRRHRCRLNDFSCVFSYTLLDDKVWRHLSVSVGDPEEKALPAPAAVKMIARLFGFTGLDTDELAGDAYEFPKTWQMQVRKNHPVDDDCIVLLEQTDLRP